MILFYSALLSVLGFLKVVVRSRARSLERKYTKVSLEAEKLANRPVPKMGNSNRNDAYQAARHYFELGRLVQRRDRLEARHFAWEGFADRLRRYSAALTRWRGRFVPYAFGVLDVAVVLYVVDRLGLARVDLTGLVEQVQTLVSR